MGSPITKLYCTNINGDSGRVLLSAWIPERREDNLYYMPKDTAIGYDMWIPNILELAPNETVEVEIVPAYENTGLWMACSNGYFADEMYLYNWKPQFKEGTKNSKMADGVDPDGEGDYDWALHVYTPNIKMEAGDGPIPVSLKIKEKD